MHQDKLSLVLGLIRAVVTKAAVTERTEPMSESYYTQAFSKW